MCLAPLVAVAAGCGGTSADAACADDAVAHCNQRSMCTSGVNVTKSFGDMTTCLAREKLSCTQALAAKDNGNSPAGIEQCTAAVKVESCSDFLAGNVPPACVHTGSRADDSACSVPGQCMSSYCTGLANAACGTCGPALATGGDCSSGGTCARGLECFSATANNGATTMTCLDGSPSGGSCSRAQPCGAGLSCVGAVNAGAMPMPGMCMTAATSVGAACDPVQRTMPGCDRGQGLFCNTTTKMCSAITFAADGAACGIATSGDLVDCANGTCYGSVIIGANPMQGACKVNAADGAACDTNNGPDCEFPARCVTASGSSTGTCLLPNSSAC
jgi:hypothetical protein